MLRSISPIRGVRVLITCGARPPGTRRRGDHEPDVHEEESHGNLATRSDLLPLAPLGDAGAAGGAGLRRPGQPDRR